MHENDRLYLSVQYDNSKHPEQEAFNLAEFIIYAMHPETQTETDVAYATLGDYQQPSPPTAQTYRPASSPSPWCWWSRMKSRWSSPPPPVW